MSWSKLDELIEDWGFQVVCCWEKLSQNVMIIEWNCKDQIVIPFVQTQRLYIYNKRNPDTKRKIIIDRITHRYGIIFFLVLLSLKKICFKGLYTFFTTTTATEPGIRMHTHTRRHAHTNTRKFNIHSHKCMHVCLHSY